MGNDMITIFNRLTCSELADYRLFDIVVDNHYEKFKYLYFMINDIDLQQINKIKCIDIDGRCLQVSIKPKNNNVLSNIVDDIDIRKTRYPRCELFSFNISIISDDEIILNISLKDNSDEGDLYVNRPV